MTKRRTKAEKIGDYFDAFKKKQVGDKVKRTGAKDGSVSTHPVVNVGPEQSEADVLKDCLGWLKKHRIMCDRHDCGAGNMTGAGYATYGIKGSGDIHGMLRRHGGKHFEIECKKSTGGRWSKKQQERCKRVLANNGLYFIIHGSLELEYFMRKWI